MTEDQAAMLGLWNAEQTRQYLVSVSKPGLWKNVDSVYSAKRRGLRSVKVGSATFFRPDDVKEWAANRRGQGWRKGQKAQTEDEER